MEYLIIGSDGYIGSYLYEHLLMDNECVIGTTRHKINIGKKIFFDMTKNDISSLPNFDWQKTVVVICAAQSKIDKCIDDYQLAYDLNVTSIVRLADEFLSKGAQVIAFSSDQVFDGIEGDYTEESVPNPLNSYGRMKADMEKFMLSLHPQPCIFRISKTVSSSVTKQNVFAEWDNTPAGSSIRCIKDNKIAFVYIDDIYRAIRKVVEYRLRGLYNIAGDDRCSRKELAERFIAQTGKDNVTVLEATLEEFLFRENRPLNVTLCNKKFKQDADFSFTSMEDVINAYIAQRMCCVRT